MKKIVLMLAVLFAGTTLSSGQALNDPNKAIQNLLTQQVKFPSELKAASFYDSVKVEVTVLPDGDVQVNQTESGNQTLRKYIEDTLNNYSLPENMVSEAVTYSLNILFKVI